MIKLGDKVKDEVSGFSGIVTGKCEYLNGCIQFLVTPPIIKDEKDKPKGHWLDDIQLKVTKASVVRPNRPELRPYGPRSEAPTDRC